MDYRDNRQRWAESHQVVHFYAGQWCTFTPALTPFSADAPPCDLAAYFPVGAQVHARDVAAIKRTALVRPRRHQGIEKRVNHGRNFPTLLPWAQLSPRKPHESAGCNRIGSQLRRTLTRRTRARAYQGSVTQSTWPTPATFLGYDPPNAAARAALGVVGGSSTKGGGFGAPGASWGDENSISS